MTRRFKSAGRIKPSGFLDYRTFLDAVYSDRKSRVRGYSYRAFSEDLGFSASTLLHQIVRGYRPLSERNAKKIAARLGIRKWEKRYFFTLVDYCNARDGVVREEFFRKLIAYKRHLVPEAVEGFWLEYCSEWFHPVIRELVSMSGGIPEPQWIAETLIPHIRPDQARESLRLLETLQLIERTPEGGDVQKEKTVRTAYRVREMALVRYHQKMMDLAKESLTGIPGKERDISASTLCVDEVTFEKIRSLIHEFQQRVMMESEQCLEGDRVVQVNVQLFPFTRRGRT